MTIKPKNPKFIDRTGYRYGMLVVKNYNGKRSNINYWICVCDCGGISEVRGNNLVSGNSASCGCQEKRARDVWREKQKIKSPHSIKLQNMYDNMIKRCYVSSTKCFHNYGGRGIDVCEEWLRDRKKFYQWAINEGVEENLTLERKNVNGQYCPENCRFATWKEQANNKRTNVILTNGGVSKSIKQWADEMGVNEFALYMRHRSGWSDERIFTQPFRKSSKRK